MLAQYTDLVLGLTAFQSLFFFVFLVSHRKGKIQSNRILAAYLLVLFFMLCQDLLFRFDFYLKAPYLAYQGTKLVFLVGPLLYFYTRSLTQKQVTFTSATLLHMIPFAAFTAIMLFAFDLKSVDEKLRLLTTDDTILHPSVSFSFLILYYLQLISYVAVSLKRLHDYQTEIRERFSSTDRISLSWLRFVLWGFAIIWMFDVTMEGVKRVYEDWQAIYAWLAALSRTWTFSYIMIFVFQGLRQPELFVATNGSKYEGSPLDEVTKSRWLEKLLEYMRIQKPFLNPELTLNRVAEDLGISPKYLSQIINEKLNRNFFDFVNGYRIDEAKKRLVESNGNRVTVLEILYDVGFNSKSSFNSAFKKHTCLTPREFKRRNQPQNV